MQNLLILIVVILGVVVLLPFMLNNTVGGFSQLPFGAVHLNTQPLPWVDTYQTYPH